ncbi:hypothetical protein GC101_27770 [Paenibacillus sp. LMG 31459]|uniref:LXG domain-containing protein n=1 Tax=Paenibacillus phytohabitans TaxID=2654978 RepID=A0ABX1YNM5_9BACL|nr:hypothetical protein [Paenibacillus phytohabitans]NOU82665.1 hypothetical protein [Paenibacillus phytohabitans]
MEDVIDFVQTFKGLEARINEFINEDSSKNEHSPHIEKFERSCALVLNYIRQDTLLWVPGLKNVIENIKSELDLQQFFMEVTR